MKLRLKKQNSKNYFNHITKNLLLLSGSFLLLLCTVLYFSYLTFTRDSYMTSLKNNSKQSAELIDNCISQSNNLVYLLSGDKAIEEYVNSYSNDPAITTDAMHSLRAGWLFHGHIALLLPDNDSVITKDSSMSIDFYADTTGFAASDLKSYYNEIISGKRQNPFVFFTSGQSANMLVMHYLNSFDRPLVVLSVFDLPKILPESGVKSNFCIMHGNELINTVGPIGFDDVQKAMNKQNFHYKALYETSVPVSYLSGNKCFYAVPTFDYIKRSHNFALILLLIILFAGIMIFIVSSFISNKIYAPIQKLVASMKDKNDTDTQDELEYISQKYTLLNDKNKNLFELVTEHSKQLSDVFFIKLINSSIPPDEVEKGVSKYGYSAYPLPVSAFVASITNFDNFSKVLDGAGIHILQEKIMNVISSGFGENEIKVHNIGNGKFVGIITADNLLSQKHRLILCLSDIETKLEVRLRVCVGDPVKSWKELSVSYNSAANILDNYYFRPSSSSLVVLSSEITGEDTTVYYPKALEKALIQNIVHAQKDETGIIVDEIIENNYKKDILRSGLHSQLVMMMAATLIKVFMTIHKSPDEVLPDESNIYATLIQHTDPKALREEYLRIAYLISDYTDSMSASVNQKITQQMLSYIYENYSQDISLLSLAAHLNLSQSHTSRLFKQLTGENFKDYLAKYRISMAKVILDKKPTIKIKDLAVAVGYSSSGTLNKVFMRYEGYLPTDYNNR